MRESNDGAGSPEAVLRAVLEEAGASDALPGALALAGLPTLPDTRELMFKFIEGPLEEALVGRVHPATARHLLDTIRERLADVDRSGTRIREDAEEGGEAATGEGAATLPPPADPVAAHEYSDLVTGAVHSRITPTWGTRAVDPDAPPAEVVWAIVSAEPALIKSMMIGAPARIDVVVVSSAAALPGALRKVEASGGAVVVDAAAPSIPLDRTIAALTSAAGAARVLLWRIPAERRARLLETNPSTRTWLTCDSEVTPREILQLLLL